MASLTPPMCMTRWLTSGEPCLLESLGAHACDPDLSGPMSRDIAILSQRYPISRNTFPGRLTSTPPKRRDTPLVLSLTQTHLYIRVISHFTTYRVIFMRYPIPSFCDTIARNIARYEKYRCWASKLMVLNQTSTCRTTILFESK